MKMRTLAWAICAALAVTGGTARAQNTIEIPVDGTFSEWGWEWRKTGGSVRILWQVARIDGSLFLCGAYQSSGPARSRNHTTALRKSWLKADGKKVVRNLTYFTKVPPRQDMTSASAACKSFTAPAGAEGFAIGGDPIRVRI